MDNLSKLNVLIIQNDKNLLYKIKTEIDNYGITTCVASSGVEAYKKLYENGNSYDYIILNIGLPDINGVDIINFIKNNFNSKIIIYTTKKYHDYKNKCQFDHFFEKNKHSISDIIKVII